jgi:hypothetical protein
LLYDVMVTNGTVNFEGPTAIQMCLMTLVESKAYLLVTTILSVLAILPYLTFIIFTVCYKSLMKPKNVFKSNFAFSAIIHLVSRHCIGQYSEVGTFQAAYSRNSLLRIVDWRCGSTHRILRRIAKHLPTDVPDMVVGHWIDGLRPPH